VWTGVENLVPTGIRFPNSPARSKPLSRLSYAGPLSKIWISLYRFSKKLANFRQIFVQNLDPESHDNFTTQLFVAAGMFNPYPSNVENMVSS